jgi:hypothetical protein
MSLSRAKNRAWLRQRERAEEKFNELLAAHRLILERWTNSLELAKGFLAQRDRMKDLLEKALKERVEMTAQIEVLRGLLMQKIPVNDGAKPGPYLN